MFTVDPPLSERTTAKYTANLVDTTGAAIAGASLDSLTLSLINVQTGVVLNSRNAQNVLNANGVTIDVNGLITWTLAPADNAIIDDRLQVEEHRAIFTAKWSGGAGELVFDVDIPVRNISVVV